MIATLCLAFLAVAGVQGCIREYGSIKEAGAHAGGHFDYSYNGLNWPSDFAACRGRKQSPVLLPAAGAAAKALGAPEAKSTFSYGTLSSPKITNNGHTLQVSLPAGFKSDVRIPIKGDPRTATGTSILGAGQGKVSYVKATPAQFHFHTHSEHIMSGAEYAMEMHIVHFIKADQLPACGAAGCPVVLGVMLALTDKEEEVSPQLRRIIEAMPLHEGAVGTIPGTIDLNALLPANRAHFMYEGSLTAPPCTEGLLWHVLATPIKVSQTLLTRYLEAVGDLHCSDKPIARPTLSRSVELEAGRSGFRPPARDAKGCAKLANGHNYRAVQPVNGRVIKLAT